MEPVSSITADVEPPPLVSPLVALPTGVQSVDKATDEQLETAIRLLERALKRY